MRLTYRVTKTTWRILKLVTVAVLVTGAVLWFVLSPIPVHFHVVARGQIATEVMGTGTREFTVDVQTLELPKNWAIGQRAEVYIETEKKEDAILVPMEYIIRRQGATGVFVVQDSYAKWRPVKFRLMSTTHAEVVDGVSEGDERSSDNIRVNNFELLF